MYPTIPTRYPEFVADQVLTAGNLDDLFNYLDVQERLTRTNLVGIGIVCGLEAYTAADGTSINVSKGVGVTSAGYMVAMPAAKYTHYSKYNAEKETYYEKFVDLSTKKQKFDLWQLAKAGAPEAETPLDKGFLGDKIILVFVELLSNGNKNCDPDSCDDKGINIDVQFRMLLVEEKNVGDLIGFKSEDNFFKPGPKCLSWPEVKLPRYNVPATTLPDTASILKNYLTILDEAFLQKIEDTLTTAYASTQLLVINELPNNPFSQLKEKLSFLYDGTINLKQLVMVQYYYDFISDLLQGYDEVRSVCNRYLAICCPDEQLFPRHLLLYAAFPSKNIYRHRFIPSPALGGSDGLVGEMRFLMKRMATMVQMLQVPPEIVPALNNKRSTPIRITPSKLGDVPLSQKAIPYYYNVLQAPLLFNAWNYQKTSTGRGNTNLSYYAPEYNSTDDYVRTPLLFDIEPHNFLRIEGHIGMSWQKALQEIYQIKYKHRLPFEVVALNGDFKSLLAFVQQSVADLGKVLAEHPEQWRKILCYFTDIEMQYDMQAAELRCTIGKVMRFLYSYPADQSTGNVGGVPASDLLQKFDATYRTRINSKGLLFDEWYPTVKDLAYMTPAQLLPQFTVTLAAGKFVDPLALMYYLEKIHEALPAGIVQLNIVALEISLRDAIVVAEYILKSLKNMAANTDGKQGDDPEYYLQLNAVIRICKGSLLLELYRNFLFRFYLYLSNQSFAMYSFLNSGIQHKAGVPIGGTFIMVYHDAMPVAATAVAANAANIAKADVVNVRADVKATENPAADNTSLINRIKERASAINKLDTSEKVFAVRNDLSTTNSVKDIGMFYIAEVVAKRAAEDELTDQELLALVDEIPDGTVIADFFLPYICASECMPMSFVVLPGNEEPPAPVKPTISIKETQYCVGDKTDYEITVTPTPPAAGSVTGEGVSINNGKVFFNPSAVNLGTALQKDITITYKVGTETADVKVTVFALPQASFKADPSPTGAFEIVLSNVVAVGTAFKWTIAGNTISTAANPQVLKVDKPGTYLVTFIASNGSCGDASIEQLVTIAEPAPTVTCTPLAQWSDAYKKWNQPTNRIFAMFMARFGSYGKVDAFFQQQLPQILALPNDKQVEALRNEASPGIIQEWMQELQKILLEIAAVRSISLELYRILEGLLLFYACMQPDDIDVAKVPTINPFKVDVDLVSAWSNIAANFTASDKEVIKRKVDDLTNELNNAKANAPAKKNYIAVLNKLIKVISAYL